MNIHTLPNANTFLDLLLCKAAMAGLTNEATLLLNLGASPDALSEKGLPALHLAAFHGWTSLTELLLEKGANPNLEGPEGVLAIHMAAFGGNLESFKRLSSFPHGPAPADSCGRRPIHYAAPQMSPKSAIITPMEKEDLVTFPPSPNFPAVIQHILDLGESLDAQDSSGKTPLHHLATEGFLKPALLLLEMGASPRIVDKEGNLPLHLAAMGDTHEHALILQHLLKDAKTRQATINLPNIAGQTPLHFAVEGDTTLCAQLLLACGARLDMTDACGKKPAQAIRSLAMAKILTPHPTPST
ncbi:MAG TPA: hypothetical protein DCW68_02875 [Rhodospirillaceae bacterium]|nr:MAG: hypothetical protein A2018_05850 [Alphaproteobacteria bacterium GWF2_58_20]HAU29035.1 hypothetical protein [Rhodospirillaceae bacterium]